MTLSQPAPPSVFAPMESRVLELATELTTSNDRVEVSRLVSEFAVEQLDIDRVSVAVLRSEDAQVFDLVAVAGQQCGVREGAKYSIDDLISGDSIRLGVVRSFDPICYSTRPARALVLAGLRSCMEAPLLSGERCFGSLNLSRRSGPIDEESASQLARLLGSQLDRIAARDRLRRQLLIEREESRRWQLLYDLESSVSNAASVDDVVSEFAFVASEVIADAHVAFVEYRRGLVVTHSGRSVRSGGSPSLSRVGFALAEHGGVLGQFGPASIKYIPDLLTGAVPDMPSGLVPRDAKSLLYVSVVGRDGPIGAVIVSSPAVDGISTRDQEMLSAIAPMVGGTLERIEVDQCLERATTRDQLTGLTRRSVFDTVVDKEIERSVNGDGSCAVVSIDVDRFKVVNDTQGHRRGDDLLVQIASRLMRMLGPDDVATRIGGDEFAVLLRARETADFEEVCHRLVSAVSSHPFAVGSESLHITVSVGFAVIDGLVASAREAISMSDAACYAAKLAGGNQARRANVDDDHQCQRRTASETLVQLRRAIDRNELLLYAQPIHDFDSGKLTAFEVLVRMCGEDGELIMPSRFLSVAERFNAIADLDAWVVKRALDILGCCGANHGDAPRLFINVSPSSVSTPGFADRIERLVADSCVVPDRLCFEITETGTMKSFDEALRFIERMKALGAMVALDDFGVGLSSLSHLYRLPVDVLKIDGSLVRGIEASSAGSSMVATIQALATSLGKTTVAEYVENDRAAEALQRVGIDCGQGFHLGRPAPLRDQLPGVRFIGVDEDCCRGRPGSAC